MRWSASACGSVESLGGGVQTRALCSRLPLLTIHRCGTIDIHEK